MALYIPHLARNVLKIGIWPWLKSIAEGLAQLAMYMDKVGESAGWLVVFDRDAATPWEEKIYMRKETLDGKEITLAGC